MYVLRKLASIRLFYLLSGLLVLMMTVDTLLPPDAGPAHSAASLYIYILLTALAVNLIACSLNRLGQIRRRPGVFVTHVAVVLILAAGLVRFAFSDSGVLPLREGEAADAYYISETETAPLPFALRLDDFRIEFYDHPYYVNAIRQFYSRITVLENGATATTAELHVNGPFSYKGYTFYQSGYDPEDPAFSSFQVSRDPSVPAAYAGFILLPVGLFWSLLEKPDKRKKPVKSEIRISKSETNPKKIKYQIRNGVYNHV